MRKCPNCGGRQINTPPKTKKHEESMRVTTIVGKKTKIGGRKTKI